MNFIENLEIILQEKGITAYKLCKDTGIKTSTISNWKNGTQPTLDKFLIIVQYLGVSADRLLNLDTDKLDQESKELLKQYKLHDESIKMSVRKLLDMQQTTEGESYNSKIG